MWLKLKIEMTILWAARPCTDQNWESLTCDQFIYLCQYVNEMLLVQDMEHIEPTLTVFELSQPSWGQIWPFLSKISEMDPPGAGGWAHPPPLPPTGVQKSMIYSVFSKYSWQSEVSRWPKTLAACLIWIMELMIYALHCAKKLCVYSASYFWGSGKKVCT